jgi:hypothetical protein
MLVFSLSPATSFWLLPGSASKTLTTLQHSDVYHIYGVSGNFQAEANIGLSSMFSRGYANNAHKIHWQPSG